MSRWPTYRVLLCWIWLALSGCGGEEGDPGWRSFAVHTVCGGSTTVKGIDVSKYQATVDRVAALEPTVLVGRATMWSERADT